MLEAKRRPKSPYWILRGTVDGRRVEISRKWTTAAAARRAIPGLLAELCADPSDQSGLTFDRALAVYLETRPDARFTAPLLRYFAGTLVADINNAEMRRAAAALYPAAAPATIRRQLYTPVKAILNAAAADDLCHVPKLTAPSGGNRRTVFFLPDQADALITSLAGERNGFLAPMATFLFGQGCRMGETVTLDGRDVSLEHRFAILRDTKNGEERRVSLVPRVVAALSTLPTVGQPGPLFRRIDGFGFRHGGANGGQIKKPFARATEAAGLDPERYTPHVCRHSWATWFYAQTKDVRRLQDEGGWKSGEWQRYTRLGTPDLGQSALRAGWDFSELGENRGKMPQEPAAARA
ncbi:site-specific integrase [Aurantimonas sp. 22II-16-19i]|uniref:tyrosine-type recombinase/integrase n=1 Tax=Aurantimonas sp. 22II-16-19i TaxID=1317114 RepID=UPI0009F7F3E9|nr:site-specific integrase [Aurantimonas sp. 22II-16-19i]ORE90951.1 integrase family protein [Aurantimonas sp. 22II-16-19i]